MFKLYTYSKLISCIAFICYISFIYPITLYSNQFTHPIREWTSNDNEIIRGRLISANKKYVILKINNKHYKTNINRFSQKDKDYIFNLLKNKYSNDNWDSSWPQKIVIDTNLIEVKKLKKNLYTYKSENFLLSSNFKINYDDAKKFIILFETIFEVFKKIPLGMSKSYPYKINRINFIKSFINKKEINSKENLSGYSVNKNKVLIRFNKNKLIFNDEKKYRLIVHEISHQLTDPIYFLEDSRGWFTEGLATYISMCSYKNGEITLIDLNNFILMINNCNNKKICSKNIHKCHYNNPINVNKSLKDFLFQPYSKFIESMNYSYKLSALIIYYFLHMDGNKDSSRIKNFLKQIKYSNSTPSKDSLYKNLLGNRSWNELEILIQKTWERNNVKINFNN